MKTSTTPVVQEQPSPPWEMRKEHHLTTTITPRTVEILTQVAFKGAIDLVAAGKFDVTDVDALTGDLTNGLVKNISAQLDLLPSAPTPAPAAPSVGSYDVEQGLADELGGEAVTIKVLGEQHGPLPTWLISQANAAGVTKVFDNREDAKGTKRPWFKTPKDADKYGEPADKPFWPPRN